MGQSNLNLRQLETILAEETHPSNKNMTFCDNWWDMFDMGNGGNCDIIRIANEVGPDPQYKCYLLYPVTASLRYFGMKESDMIYFTFGREKVGIKDFKNLGEAILHSYYENVKNRTNMLGISFLKHHQTKTLYIELNLFVPRSQDGIIFRLDRDRKHGIVFRSIETSDASISMYCNVNNDSKSFGFEISAQENMQSVRAKYKDLKYGWAKQFGYVSENSKFFRT